MKELEELEIASAQHIPIERLHEAMVDAYSDYVLPTKLDLNGFKGMLNERSYSADDSFVVIENEDVVAFWLTGVNARFEPGTFYALTVGTRPTFRRRGLTLQLFAKLKEHATKQGARRIVLECITSNDGAHAAYVKMGFENLRKVRGFSGPLNVFQNSPEEFEVRWVDAKKALKISQSFGDWRATWQNGFGAFERTPDDVAFLCVFDSQMPIGLGCFNRSNGAIRHLCFASAMDREAMAEHLIASILPEQKVTKASYINIDETDIEVIKLLIDRGWESVIDQFEMSYSL